MNIQYHPQSSIKYLPTFHKVKSTNLMTSRYLSEPQLKPFIIYFDSKLKFTIQICESIVLLYNVLITPLSMAYDYTDNVNAIFGYCDNVTDSIFFLVMVFRCFTAYINDKGELVDSHKRIFWNYLTGWLLIDLVSIFPYQLFVKIDLSHVRTLKLLKEQRLFKLFYCRNLFPSLSHTDERNLTFLILFTFYIHILICAWLTIGKLGLQAGTGWILHNQLTNSTLIQLYCEATYFMIETLSTIGYGDKVPTTLYQIIYVIVVCHFGVITYSIIMLSTVGSIRKAGILQENKNNKLTYFAQIFKILQLTKQMQTQIFKIIKSKIKKEDLEAEYQFMTKLPLRKRAELSCLMHKKMIEENFYLRTHKDNWLFIGQLCIYLQEIFISADTEFELFQQVYFLEYGQFSIILQVGDIITHLADHTWHKIGLVQLLEFNTFPIRYKVTKNMKVYRLKKENYKKVFRYFFVDYGKKLEQSAIQKYKYLKKKYEELEFKQTDKFYQEANFKRHQKQKKILRNLVLIQKAYRQVELQLQD